jgi:hypothetical protein
VLGVRRWRELVIDRKKWRGFFDWPKPTRGCSAFGRRRRRRRRRRSCGYTLESFECVRY